MNDLSRRNVLKLATATGLASFVGGTALGADQDRLQNKPDDKWRAWAVTKGEQTRLIVEGIYSQGGPGLVALVKEAAPQGTNPKILLLKLQTATLPGVWPAILRPIPAHFTKSPYKAGQYDSIHILYPNGDAVMIDRITDTGAGPQTIR